MEHEREGTPMADRDGHDCARSGCTFASRRSLLSGVAALAAAAALPRLAGAEEFDPAPRRVDVHHHFFPPAWLAHAEQRRPGPAPAMREWSAARVVELMDASGVATAIASLSPWGLAFAEAPLLPKLARDCNDYAAKMIADHRG